MEDKDKDCTTCAHHKPTTKTEEFVIGSPFVCVEGPQWVRVVPIGDNEHYCSRWRKKR